MRLLPEDPDIAVCELPLVHAVGNGPAHRGALGRTAARHEIETGQAGTVIALPGIPVIAEAQLNPAANCLGRHNLVQERIFAARQSLHHRIVPGMGIGQAVDARLLAVLVALVPGVHGELRRRPVKGFDPVGSRAGIRMDKISRFRIQDRLPQEVRREERLPVRIRFIPDIRAVLAVIHPAPRGNHPGRVRTEAEAGQFKEVRQRFLPDDQGELAVADNAHTGQFPGPSGAVLLIAQQVIRLFRTSAQVADQGAALQQDGESVVPRGHRRSVREIQVVAEHDLIPPVAVPVRPGDRPADHGMIKPVLRKAAVPFDEVIPRHQVPDIHVTGDVPPHTGKETTVELRGVTDGRVFIVAAFRSGPFPRAFSGRGGCAQGQDQCQQDADTFFHRIFLSPDPGFPSYSEQTPVLSTTKPSPAGISASNMETRSSSPVSSGDT